MVNAGKIVPAPGITVHTDKHGVTREYREVKRKATVGELVKITSTCVMGENHSGRVYTVVSVFDSDSGVVDTDGKYDDDSVFNPDATEYVVLELTDIVHHDGKRWREVKRKASVGELIHMFDHYHTPVQGIRLVTSIDPEADSVHFWVDGTRFGTPYIRSGQSKPCYTVLELADQPSATVAERIDALEQRVAALEQHVEVLSDKQWLREVERAYSESDSPQQYTREQVIELAKKDVEALVFHGKDSRTDNFDVLKPGSQFWGQFYTVDFRIDRPKRTVVALISDGTRNKRKPDAIGKSKSAPDDCFNVHIGKSIALRRALGLDVPDYYVNAPKPTEAKVGDVVTFPSVKSTTMYHVRTLEPTPGNLRIVKSSFDSLVGGGAHVDSYSRVIILDDSHDFGGDSTTGGETS